MNWQWLKQLEGLIRTTVRPAVTLIFVSVASWMVLTGLDVPEWYKQTVGMVVAFWFGSRIPKQD